MIDTKELINQFKLKRISAEVIDDVHGEIQLKLTTRVAEYIVVIIEFDDRIDLSGNVCSVRDTELHQHLQRVIENDQFNYWTADTYVNISCEDLVDEIIFYIDDSTTSKTIRDLYKFINYIEKLKSTYEDTAIPIVNMISEIVYDYLDD